MVARLEAIVQAEGVAKKMRTRRVGLEERKTMTLIAIMAALRQNILLEKAKLEMEGNDHLSALLVLLSKVLCASKSQARRDQESNERMNVFIALVLRQRKLSSPWHQIVSISRDRLIQYNTGIW